MMMGAGFMKDMIASSRNNRTLLKGDKTTKYKNFDKSYITDWVISRKPLKFKTATPEYLGQLRLKMKRQRRINILKGIVAGLVSASIVGVTAFLFLV